MIFLMCVIFCDSKWTLESFDFDLSSSWVKLKNSVLKVKSYELENFDMNEICWPEMSNKIWKYFLAISYSCSKPDFVLLKNYQKYVIYWQLCLIQNGQ